ncbi:MAG: Na+:solute symporter [candidate division KSB1 bacterium]|nr:Na+:solute symporter [candidate division KSB1 bacterium]
MDLPSNIQPLPFRFQGSISPLDWFIVLLYVLFSLVLGLYFSRRGTKDISAYFASGRGVPWWLLGTSMVATTFAADTPLAISGLVVKQGIWGNWFWWAQVPMFMLGVFFFSRLWRRAGILTDTELVNVRYSGTSARILRGFRAVYFALPYNLLVMGWVNLSMTKIMALAFGISKQVAVPICILITVSYCAISGLWGVMATDFFQFFLAMGMAIVLAVIAVSSAGGIGHVIGQMTALYGKEKAASMLSLVPSPANTDAFHVFLLYVLLLWWTVGNTDGGAYLAQRMIAAKNEKHSFLGYLWFNVAHFCLRPWPWILVGMVAAVQFPGIVNPQTGAPDPELGYIAVMLTHLGPGLLGLMMASFLAAFMSTISTQLNWAASYLVNDLYRPFIRPGASEKHYVWVSIAATVLIALLGGAVTFLMTDIFRAWLLLSAINAGIGIVYIARWYWWRVNAWSEISAILAILGSVAVILYAPNPGVVRAMLLGSVVLALLAIAWRALRDPGWWSANWGLSTAVLFAGILAAASVLGFTLPEKAFPWTLLYTVPVSLVIWLAVTLLTDPVAEDQLLEFYRRVHPGGPGWRRIAARLQGIQLDNVSLFTRKNIAGSLLGIVAVYSVLLGFGKLILSGATSGLLLLLLAAVCVVGIVRLLSEEKWATG